MVRSSQIMMNLEFVAPTHGSSVSVLRAAGQKLQFSIFLCCAREFCPLSAHGGKSAAGSKREASSEPALLQSLGSRFGGGPQLCATRAQGEDRGQACPGGLLSALPKKAEFGLSLIVASQRPSEISSTIISQCANFFSHRLQNPDDIDHFKRIIPRQAQRLLTKSLCLLPVRQSCSEAPSMYPPEFKL